MITDLEKTIIRSIEKGWITDEEGLLDLIRTY
jgi:hypothetical protein